jgi:tetratricopeptide (TPR) repeat protein
MRSAPDLFEEKRKPLSLKIKNIMVALGLLVLCFVVYGNSLNNGFMMDDYGLMLERTAAHDLRHLSGIILEADAADPERLAHYRPVSGVLRAVLFHAFKTDPFFYHLTNLLLFYFYCLLVLVFLRATGLDVRVSILAVVLFCVHPVNTMPVNYITAHEVLLFGIFSVLTLFSALLFSKTRRPAFYVLGLVLFAVCLLTQEITVTLPLYIWLMSFFVARDSLRRSVLLSLPYFVLAGLYLAFRMEFAGIKINILQNVPWQNFDIFSYTASLLQLIGWYAGKLFYPQDIVLIWSVAPLRDHLWVRNLAGLLIVALIVILLAKYWKRGRNSFWLLWFLAGFLPVTLLCFIYPAMGLVIEPHWFFVSSFGFFVLAATVLEALRRRVDARVWLAAVLSMTVILGFMTRDYNALWKTQERYCRYWLRVAPENHGPNFWLGHAYLKEGDYARAKIYFQKALVGGFIDWQVLTNLGLIEQALGNSERAVAYFKKALEFHPGSGVVYNNLGVIAVEQGRLADAGDSFERAVELDPYLMEPRLNLAGLYARAGRLPAAMELLEKNFFLDPHDQRTRRLLLEFYLASDEKQKALDLAQDVLRQSRDAGELIDFGSILAANRLTKAAGTFYFRAMVIDPNAPDAYLEAGKLYGNLEDFNRALSLWREGAKRNPEDPRFLPLMERARQLQGQQD